MRCAAPLITLLALAPLPGCVTREQADLIVEIRDAATFEPAPGVGVLARSPNPIHPLRAGDYFSKLPEPRGALLTDRAGMADLRAPLAWPVEIVLILPVLGPESLAFDHHPAPDAATRWFDVPVTTDPERPHPSAPTYQVRFLPERPAARPSRGR